MPQGGNSSMAQTLQSILVILVSLALLIAGTSLLGTLLAVRMSIEGFPHGIIGPILAFHSLGFVLGTLYAAPIIRRVGHIRSFAALAAIACVAALLHPMYVTALTWAGLRVVIGFCSAGLMMVMESWINDRTSNTLRGSIMATYMATTYLAQGSGQFALSLGEPQNTTLFMIAAALIATSLVPLALTRSKAPVIEQQERMGLRMLYGVAPIAIVAAATAGAAMSAFMAVLPVYAQQVGYRVSQISLLMGLIVLAGMALQWPIGRLSDRRDRRVLIVALAALGTAVCVPLVMFGAQQFLVLLLAGGLFFGMAGSIYPMSVALTNDYLHQHQMVSASAMLLLIFGIGTIVGPIGGSLAMSALGPEGLFMFVGAVVLLLVVFGLYRHLTARRFPVEEQSEFVPVVTSSTPVIYAIDPRNEDFHSTMYTPAVERRRSGPDRRGGAPAGGRRRTDATDFNE
jgi:MFS family permease